MNITLKNDLIEKALYLRSEVFHFYMSLVYVLKQEENSNTKSIAYNVNNKNLYRELKKHTQYDKSQRSFDKSIKKLQELRLIKKGFAYKKIYIDIFHKSEEFDKLRKNYSTDIPSNDLKDLILKSTGNQLKFAIKNLILDKELLKLLKTRPNNYLANLYKITDRGTLKPFKEALRSQF